MRPIGRIVGHEATADRQHGASALLTPMYQSGSRFLPLLRDRLLAPLGALPGIRQGLTALVSGDLIPPISGRPFP